MLRPLSQVHVECWSDDVMSVVCEGWRWEWGWAGMWDASLICSAPTQSQIFCPNLHSEKCMIYRGLPLYTHTHTHTHTHTLTLTHTCTHTLTLTLTHTHAHTHTHTHTHTLTRTHTLHVLTTAFLESDPELALEPVLLHLTIQK